MSHRKRAREIQQVQHPASENPPRAEANERGSEGDGKVRQGDRSDPSPRPLKVRTGRLSARAPRPIATSHPPSSLPASPLTSPLTPPDPSSQEYRAPASVGITIADIPYEVMGLALGKLPPTQARSARRVCKTWRDAVDHLSIGKEPPQTLTPLQVSILAALSPNALHRVDERARPLFTMRMRDESFRAWVDLLNILSELSWPVRVFPIARPPPLPSSSRPLLRSHSRSPSSRPRPHPHSSTAFAGMCDTGRVYGSDAPPYVAWSHACEVPFAGHTDGGDSRLMYVEARQLVKWLGAVASTPRGPEEPCAVAISGFEGDLTAAGSYSQPRLRIAFRSSKHQSTFEFEMSSNDCIDHRPSDLSAWREWGTFSIPASKLKNVLGRNSGSRERSALMFVACGGPERGRGNDGGATGEDGGPGGEEGERQDERREGGWGSSGRGGLDRDPSLFLLELVNERRTRGSGEPRIAVVFRSHVLLEGGRGDSPRPRLAGETLSHPTGMTPSHSVDGDDRHGDRYGEECGEEREDEGCEEPDRDEREERGDEEDEEEKESSKGGVGFHGQRHAGPHEPVRIAIVKAAAVLDLVWGVPSDKDLRMTFLFQQHESGYPESSPSSGASSSQQKPLLPHPGVGGVRFECRLGDGTELTAEMSPVDRSDMDCEGFCEASVQLMKGDWMA